MENRLNLDALKKELSSKNGSSSSAFSPTAGGGGAATVQIVQKASPQIGGLKLVSLDGPQVEVKKSSGIKLVSFIEPVLIVFIGVMVGVLLVAIMLPFFEFGKAIQNL